VKLLAFDLGDRRVGVALHDDPDLPARPLTTLEVNRQNATDVIAAFVTTERPDAIVVGLPLRLDGREGTSSRAARRIARALGERTGVPVHLQDERLTTVAAHRNRIAAGVRGRAEIDSHAAAVILQTYIDTQSRSWRRDEPPA